MRSRRFARPTFRHAAISSASLLALCLATAAHADEPISADRPDFVESSSVVGKGRFQLETGFNSEHHKADGVKERATSTPTLLRFGLSDSLEFRVSSDGFSRLRSEDTTTGITTRERGYSDLNIGIKWNTHEGDAASNTPAMAWLLHADLETGSRAFRGDGVRPSLRFVAEWDLPNDWSVGVMPGIFAEKNEDGDRYVGASRPSPWARAGRTAFAPMSSWPASNWPPRRTAATSSPGTPVPPTWSPTMCRWTSASRGAPPRRRPTSPGAWGSPSGSDNILAPS